jgi:hypothetical protein
LYFDAESLHLYQKIFECHHHHRSEEAQEVVEEDMVVIYNTCGRLEWALECLIQKILALWALERVDLLLPQLLRLQPLLVEWDQRCSTLTFL